MTGAMSPNTPMGATSRMPRMIWMHTSDIASTKSTTTRALGPAAMMPNPKTTAMTMTWSMVASAMGWKKLEGKMPTMVSMREGAAWAS